MGEVTDDVDEVVRAVVEGTGSAVVAAGDPESVALTIADAIDGDLIDEPRLLPETIDRLRVAVGDRTIALSALEVDVRLQDDPAEVHVVAEVTGLRRLVEDIIRAEELVNSTRSSLRERAATSSAMAVHPETVRAAAAEVTTARATTAGLEREVVELISRPAPTPHLIHEPPDGLVDGPRGAPPIGSGAGLDLDPGAWDADERWTLIRALGAFVASLLVGIVALVIVDSPAALLLPVLALGWVGVVVAQHRQSMAGRDEASSNLATVSALTDLAYGGVDPEGVDEDVVAANRRLEVARDRQRYAEDAWRRLVGNDADADALDEILATRDPQHEIGDGELARTPTVRAAQAHRRRLLAQWKLAWYALDRPVPRIDGAGPAIDGLAAEGIEAITVPIHGARSDERADGQRRFESLAAGRSIDELRTAAGVSPGPVVVLDERVEITAEALASQTSDLPDDVRVLVVQPDRSATGETTV